jgi:pseudouridine synthase
MTKSIRLDKYLADMGYGTRTEVKAFIRSGNVKVNESVCKSADVKVNIDKDIVKFRDSLVDYEEFEYYILNKPKGVVSATKDNVHDTVISLIKTSKAKDLFPVGRLDIDTEGLLLITNNGALAHELLSPKKHIDKTYLAHIEGNIPKNAAIIFSEGIILKDKTKLLPAKLEILKQYKNEADTEFTEVTVTIHEGKFHQVKRMFEAVGTKVIYLKRISMGKLVLPNELNVGEYRKLEADEINFIKDLT